MRTLAALALFLAVLPAGAADPQLLNLVMPEVQVLAGINVDQAKGSPFGQYLLSVFARDDRQLMRFAEATGFDPRHDVREVLVASAGGSEATLLLVKGSFDTERLLRTLERLGGARQEHNGVGMVVSKRGNEALAVIDSVAVGGHPNAVKAAIDRRASGSVLAPELMVKVNQWSMTQDAWAVAHDLTGLAPRRSADLPLNLELLEKLDSAAGGVKFGATVQVSAEAVAENEVDAKALADVARMLVQLALVRNNDPVAAAILRSLAVSIEARTVKLSVSVPQEQIERLFMPQHHRMRVKPAVHQGIR